jgi:hypothetical protein
MTFTIYGYDVTGGWSLQKYSPQKGHTICLWTSLKDNDDIEHITWTIHQTRNVVTYEGIHVIPHHVFQKEWQGELHDAEGEVKVTCTVKLQGQQEVVVVQREFFVVPEVKCAIQLEQRPPISSDTRFINLEGYPLCAAITLGMPFEDNEEYACGGACLEQCPEYEIICSPLQGCRVTHYGKHKVTAQVGIRSSLFFGINESTENNEPITNNNNDSCVSLYRDNHLGKVARYPPLKACFCIFPREEELKIIVTGKKEFQRYLVLEGLSKYMLPHNSTITWRITRKTEGRKRKSTKVVKQNNHPVFHNFKCHGIYKIIAEVRICGCDEVTHSKSIFSI